MINLNDKIVEHLYSYGDNLPHKINDFLKSINPTPTYDQITNAITSYRSRKPPYITTSRDNRYLNLGQLGGQEMIREIQTLDNLTIEVSLTTDGQNYWSNNLSKQQPTIHYEDKRDYSKQQIVEGDNYGQTNQDSPNTSFLKEDLKFENANPAKEHPMTITRLISWFGKSWVGQLILLVVAGLIVAFFVWTWHWT